MTARKSSRKAPPRAKPAGAGRRIEKVEATRRELFQAALKVVGESGYAGSSIARIAARAQVAQGTFYNYFTSQQDVFDQLLPYLGNRLLAQIRERLKGCTDPYEREAIGFAAYFDFLRENPEFERILSEAAVFTPQGFHDHVQNIVSGYMRAFRYSRARGVLPHYGERELEAVTYILLGARAYLSRRYLGNGSGRPGPLPDWVATTYMKFLRFGLTGPRRAREATRPGVATTETAAEPLSSGPRITLQEPNRAIAEAHYGGGTAGLLAFLGELAQAAARAAHPAISSDAAAAHFSCTIVAAPGAGPVFAIAQSEGMAGPVLAVAVRLAQDASGSRPLATALVSFVSAA